MLSLNLCSINNIIKLLFLCWQFYSFRIILNVSNWSNKNNVKGKSKNTSSMGAEFLVIGNLPWSKQTENQPSTTMITAILTKTYIFFSVMFSPFNYKFTFFLYILILSSIATSKIVFLQYYDNCVLLSIYSFV